MDRVLILLTAYNGKKFVPAMIDSLLAQDYPDLAIVASDDQSTDGTVDILEDYAARFPDRFRHYRSGLKFGNAQSHFIHLLQNFHDADYIMFCDQDDVWHTDKVSRTLKFIKTLETADSIPVLVHTDLHVVDENLAQMHPSFCQYSNIDGSRVAFNQLLVHNVVTGCTVMMNRALADFAASEEMNLDAVVMHDWWLAILAAACGKVGFLNEPTIEYRQHSSNTVGAQNVRSFAFAWQRLRHSKNRKAMGRCIAQAKAIADAYGDRLPASAKETLDAFVSTEGKSLFYRNRIYRKYRLYKYGFTRRMAQIFGL